MANTAGQAYPLSTANEPGSSLVPGESFSPWLEYYNMAPALVPEPAAASSLTIEVPPATTLIAPAAVPQAGGVDWITLLIVAGVLLLLFGGNEG